ncbi:hypothetical protein LINPERPRIM_LOCUS30048 [Linum perenne]
MRRRRLALQWLLGFCYGKKNCRVPISQFMVYGLYKAPCQRLTTFTQPCRYCS